MGKMLPLLQLKSVPLQTDLALLILRLWIGLTMLLNHGWDKVAQFSKLSGQFPDPLGIGSMPSLGLAMGAEVVGSVLLVAGLLTRLSALGGAIIMAVAFFCVHGGVMKGAGGGELAFIYLAAYVTIFLAGSGRFALDARMR